MLARAIALFACLVAAAGIVARAERPEPAPVRAPFAQFPMAVGDWRGTQQPLFDDQVLKVLGVDDYLTRIYYAPDRSGVGLYIGYWGSQRQGDTMHSPLNCLPGSGWEPVSNHILRLPVAGKASPGAQTEIGVNRYVVRKGLDRQLVLYWYQSHGRVVASEYWGKFYLIRDAMYMNRTDGALVRVIAPILNDNDEGRAERTAAAFVKALFPVLSAYLPV